MMTKNVILIVLAIILFSDSIHNDFIFVTKLLSHGGAWI